MRKPAFKRGWRLIERSDGSIYIGRSAKFYKITGLNAEDCRLLIGLLDGSRTVEEIELEFYKIKGQKFNDINCKAIINALESSGVLYENDYKIPKELTERELLRYDRQIRYWVGYETEENTRYDIQLRLLKSKVAIIGLGGIGSWVAYTLVGAGIGEIIGIDPDVIDTSNLNRQILYNEESIGLPKVDCAKKTLNDFNNTLKFKGFQEAVIDKESAKRLIKDVDFVVLAADHPPRYLRRWVSEACGELNIPYIILGGTLIGPLVEPDKTACFGCYEAFLREKESDYDSFVDQLVTAQPTQTSAAFMSSIIGGLVSKDVVLYLAGVGKPLTLGQLVRFDMDNATSSVLPIKKRQDCKFCSTEKRSFFND